MSASSEIPVILNPKACSGGAQNLTGILGSLSPRISLRLTQGPEDAERLAREAALEGAEIVVGAGGDGTVNQVARGLLSARLETPTIQTALGILPTGTMNVLARELNIPLGSVEAAWEIVEKGERRRIDLWQAGDQPFLQIAGVGADAEVITRTSWKAKQRLGPLSYVLAAIGVIGRNPPPLLLKCEKNGEFEGSTVLVGSGRYYGGPFELFPEARNDDGLLDVLVLRRHGPLELINLLKAVALSGYADEPDLDYFQSPGFTVEHWRGSPATPLQVDGELAGETPTRFENVSGGMIVTVPPSRA